MTRPAHAARHEERLALCAAFAWDVFRKVGKLGSDERISRRLLLVGPCRHGLLYRDARLDGRVVRHRVASTGGRSPRHVSDFKPKQSWFSSRRFEKFARRAEHHHVIASSNHPYKTLTGDIIGHHLGSTHDTRVKRVANEKVHSQTHKDILVARGVCCLRRIIKLYRTHNDRCVLLATCVARGGAEGRREEEERG